MTSDTKIQALVRSVKSVRDMSMRRALMIEKLSSGDPAVLIETLLGLIARGGRGDIDVSLTLAALVAALDTDALPYQVRAELYTRANELAAPELAYILLEGEAPSETGAEESPRPIAPKGQAMPLGSRKSAARTRNPQTLSHLLNDPNPQVIEILLGNPDLREDQVLVIASRRPGNPAALALTSRHPRWSQSRRIRLALALNPACAVPLACRLCLDLRDSDLKEIRRANSLSTHVRAHAERILALRTQLGTSSKET